MITIGFHSVKARAPGLVRRVEDPIVGVFLSSKLSTPKSELASDLKGRLWPYIYQLCLPPKELDQH
jgi:hypothetical protein